MANALPFNRESGGTMNNAADAIGGFFDTSKNPDFRIYTNVDDVVAMLKDKPYRQAENAVRAAIRSAAKIVKTEARRTVRVDTGALKKAIGIKVSAIPGGAFARIGVVDDPRWLVTKTRNKQGGYNNILGRKLKVSEYELYRKREVKRPRLYAPYIEEEFPFLGPALKKNKEAIQTEFRRRLAVDMAKPWGKSKKNVRVWP